MDDKSKLCPIGQRLFKEYRSAKKTFDKIFTEEAYHEYRKKWSNYVNHTQNCAICRQI